MKFARLLCALCFAVYCRQCSVVTFTTFSGSCKVYVQCAFRNELSRKLPACSFRFECDAFCVVCVCVFSFHLVFLRVSYVLGCIFMIVCVCVIQFHSKYICFTHSDVVLNHVAFSFIEFHFQQTFRFRIFAVHGLFSRLMHFEVCNMNLNLNM